MNASFYGNEAYNNGLNHGVICCGCWADNIVVRRRYLAEFFRVVKINHK